MKSFKIFFCLFCLQIWFVNPCNAQTANYQTIPLPKSIVSVDASPFVLDAKTKIIYSQSDGEEMRKNAEFLVDYIKDATRMNLVVEKFNGEITKKTIRLTLDKRLKAEAYRINVSSELINVSGGSPSGVFYGIQTLRKSMPISQLNGSIVSISTSHSNVVRNMSSKVIFPAVEIKDEPRFPYRGMHLDVCRHFFDIDFVKRYIDLLALHGINTLHWHISDDQGWRIEIKKYPLLTEIGSVRNRTVVGKYNSGVYDETPYGGYYTQEEIKEVVEYARDRHISIIPEIDLPGHTLAVLAAYPDLGCTGGPYEVCPDWGIFPDVLCLGNEKSYRFLYDVLDEIVELFPSKYIHIGGDEVPRDRWKNCGKCQAKIKEIGLESDSVFTAEDRLQTYCMARVAEYLSSKGRITIGWDEVLDGDAIENVIVMSWRGRETCLNAIKQGKDVVLVPTSHFYFDYYQTDDIENEPLSIGGYIPIEKVYSYEPVPQEISPQDACHILGVQANIWTEYIQTEEHLEYMVLPRMAALAEVQWLHPQQKKFDDFARRIGKLTNMYDFLGYNYSSRVFDIKAEFTPSSNGIKIALSTIDNAPIVYKLSDSSEEFDEIYSEPFVVGKTVSLTAQTQRLNNLQSQFKQDLKFSKSTLKDIDLDTTYLDAKYSFGGAVTLVDGLQGDKNFSTGRWLGFVGGEVALTIDLGKKQKISSVATTSFVDYASWIMALENIDVYVSSDNKKYEKVESEQMFLSDRTMTFGLMPVSLKFKSIKTRFVKLLLRPASALPRGHSGAGNKPYMFIDEIVIN